jgi:FO synthase
MATDTTRLNELLRAAARDRRPEAEAALAHLVDAPLAPLLAPARELTQHGFGNVVTYSRKVFIPLTQLCRDVCHYCTFAKAPRRLKSPYLAVEEVLEIARSGESAGCKEALFTLGDQPELRYDAARRALDQLGCATTLEYVKVAAGRVLAETGLLPHLNPGVMAAQDFAALRPVAASMGLMLETASPRLSERGGPHFGSPDKLPERRLATLRAAGEARVAMTSGLLIGIGETRRERIEALLALRGLHDEFGHIQEIIIQNFRAKPGTKMARAPEPELDEQLWTIAVARLLFGPAMSIQAPPNLQPEALAQLIDAGINDWGGVSPVTPDHVNPEAPWPHLADLERRTAAAGRALVERLALGPAYAREPEQWTDAALTPRVRRMSDANGWARTDRWFAGSGAPLPAGLRPPGAARGAVMSLAGEVAGILARAQAGEELAEAGIARLFAAQGRELDLVLATADRLRAETVGDTVTYVVNRNINYTNICLYHCGFCAFSKGRGARDLRGPAYNLDLEEIAQRTVEAHAAGATEVCLQGGIHPSFTGETYLSIVAAVKAAVPSMHVHAFSPLEVTHGATTLGLPLREYLLRLQEAGLSTLPGTAAEILDDEIRAQICPDKLRTAQWLDVVATAHRVGLRTTATIMFGHLEQPQHWARHLLRLRRLQAATGGITEFVPLPYVHMEAPLWRKGRTRSGPTFREALLMHAIARIALHPLVPNIQASWVKLGADGVAMALQAGANDMGGTLMDESITRSAGGVHGQEFDAEQLTALAASIGRPALQRTTLYGPLATGAAESPGATVAVAARGGVAAH